MIEPAIDGVEQPIHNAVLGASDGPEIDSQARGILKHLVVIRDQSGSVDPAIQ